MANEGQVKRLIEGTATWNEWRQQNPNAVVDLRNANLKDAFLLEANLQGADLRDANLQNANLSRINLQDANLRGAKLQGANFVCADLLDANLDRANLQGANFTEAVLRGANLRGAKLRGATLYRAYLQGADVRSVVDLRLNNTLVKDALFSTLAPDPWSVLRRTYTGPKFTFQLLALIAFALPYIGKTAFWSFVNRAQGYTQGLLETIRLRAQEQGIDDLKISELGLSPEKITPLSQCLSEVCQQRSVWQLMLGVDQNSLYWMLPLTLIVYNVLRGGLTYFVAPMRDEEERSGYSPHWVGEGLHAKPPMLYHKTWWQGYRVLYYVHRVVFVLGFIALAAFLYNAWHWLGQPIYLPVLNG